MRYIVVDLEMCKVPKRNRTRDYHYSQEIIEIGAVMLDDNYEMIDLYDTYVSPVYGEMDSFIEKLTGIKASDLEDAPELPKALEDFASWCGSKENVCFYAWSGSDFRQFEHEVICKSIHGSFNAFLSEEYWKDYQQIFGQRFAFDHAVSLDHALDLTRLEIEGNMHSGLDDACNTARMIQKLETNPDYELPEYWKAAKEEKTDRLSFSLGDLFSSLNLAGFQAAQA